MELGTYCLQNAECLGDSRLETLRKGVVVECCKLLTQHQTYRRRNTTRNIRQDGCLWGDSQTTNLTNTVQDCQPPRRNRTAKHYTRTGLLATTPKQDCYVLYWNSLCELSVCKELKEVVLAHLKTSWLRLERRSKTEKTVSGAELLTDTQTSLSSLCSSLLRYC